MGKTRFVINPELTRRLLRDVTLLPVLKDVADAAADTAKGLAPVAEGDYRDGIEVRVGQDAKSVWARVNANDFKSHWIEFGTIDTPAFAPLRRAVLGGLGLNVTGGEAG